MSGSAVDYQLRMSARARNVRLCVTVQKGLEVVVPRGYDIRNVPRVLERSRRWIQAALLRVESQRKALAATPPWQLPLQVELRADGTVWQVEGRKTGARRVSVREQAAGRLLASGPIEDEASCRDALTRWLMHHTRNSLVPRLQDVSFRTGLKYERALVRRQATRWASCSARRTISLNAKLLFLPPDLVDYVLVHELCHLEELNHSKRFWALVHRHHPDFRRHKRLLRELWGSIPRWAS
ncbi:MAG: SprT family zinc-dependent metalloprotease [Candidatus Brocadiia bacterium]|jgi:predicted metal-dependent hydrolase